MLLMKKEKPENSRNKLFDGHPYFSSTDATRFNFLDCKRMGLAAVQGQCLQS